MVEEYNNMDNIPLSINAIEFCKDSQHAPQEPNQDLFKNVKESLKQNEAINVPMRIHIGKHRSTFGNGVTLSTSEDSRVDDESAPLVLCINHNEVILGREKDELGNDEYSYLTELDEDSSTILKCMIAYETIDLRAFPLSRPVRICFDDELDTSHITNTTISDIIYMGEYRTRKGRLTNPDKRVTFVNDSYLGTDQKSRQMVDQRDRMKYELSYFIEHTDDDGELSSLDGLVYKYHYITHELTGFSADPRMDEVIDLIKRLRSYPHEMGDDLQDYNKSQIIYQAYLKYGIAILDGIDFSHATFF